MSVSLIDIAQTLKDNNKIVQLIYAFNGTGKTRLSRAFKSLVHPKTGIQAEEIEVTGLASKKTLYYNAFTEDLFYWDNDLENDVDLKLRIHPNSFTEWVLNEQGQDQNVISNFQNYTNRALTPKFSPDFSEVTFSFERGNEETTKNIKISKCEESCFIWSIFYSLLEQVIEVLNIDKDSIYQERETDKFDNLEYVFIDDPVTSLDENHLIEFAVDLAEMIKNSKSDLKFLITTHNPLFYNVLSNEFNNKNKQSGYNPNKHFIKYCLTKNEDFNYELNNSNDSPFSYHLFLLDEIKIAIEIEQIYKYHFSFLRNILEKTATFLGYDNWGDLLTPVKGERESYIRRILNLSSHSKHSAEEIVMITDDDKRMLTNLVKEISTIYKFNSN